MADQRPLKGVRVVDLTHVFAGPYCTYQLVLLGADVIKIERPHGDEFRWYGSDPGLDGSGPAFVAVNSGKRSVVLDLKRQDHKDVLRRLLETADVLVENFRPGVLGKLGFGWEANRRLNPKLVHCSITGFGHTGPLRDHPAYDHTVQAACGLMTLTGEEHSPPMKVGLPLTDTVAGHMGAFAILAALLQRQSTGTGQFIDVAMLDASLAFMTSMVAPYLISGEEPKRVGNRSYNLAPASDTFPAADKPVAIGANTQKQFEVLCRILGVEELVTDPRFTTHQLRLEHGDALQARLREALSKRPAEEWAEALTAAGVPSSTVRSIPEICGHPHVQGRGVFLEIELGGAGCKATIPGAGYHFAADGPTVAGGPPRLGEHTDEVLREIGYSPEQVAAFHGGPV